MNNENKFEMNSLSGDEIKTYKRTFSKIAIALLLFLLITQIAARNIVYLVSLLKPEWLTDPVFSMTANALSIYIIALPFLLFGLINVPKLSPKKRSLGARKLFCIFGTVMFFTEIGSRISLSLSKSIKSSLGVSVENATSDLVSSTPWYIVLIFVGILAPLFEELIFRKILITRLLPFGEMTAAVLSAASFALWHGNIYQLFYAFSLGFVCAYVFIKTGKVRYSVILHAGMNFAGSVIPLAIRSLLSPEALKMILETGNLNLELAKPTDFAALFALTFYNLIYIGLAVFGAVYLLRNMKKISFKKGIIPSKNIGEVIFSSLGTIALIIFFTVTIGINTFA